MYFPNGVAQICLMDEETRDEVCGFVPPYEQLCATAPNEEMVEEWIGTKELFESIAEKRPEFKGFAFNCVYMVSKSKGGYEVLQHPGVRSLSEIIDWISRHHMGGV